jgi:hypothetical protein
LQLCSTGEILDYFILSSRLQANLGTARLLVQALQQQGLSAAAAKSRIWMVDSKGLILNSRQNLTPEKAEFAQRPSNFPGGTAAAAAGFIQSSSSSSSSSRQDAMQPLAAIVAAVQPTALIGAAAVQGAFDQPVIAALTQVRPDCELRLQSRLLVMWLRALWHPCCGSASALCCFEQS